MVLSQPGEAPRAHLVHIRLQPATCGWGCRAEAPRAHLPAADVGRALVPHGVRPPSLEDALECLVPLCDVGCALESPLEDLIASCLGLGLGLGSVRLGLGLGLGFGLGFGLGCELGLGVGLRFEDLVAAVVLRVVPRNL